MTTTFTELPVVDLAPLRSINPSEAELDALAGRLHDVFSTVGFAYLKNAPLSLNEDAVFDIAREFFAMSEADKMQLAKRSFRNDNHNTYRGYFPAQAGSDNLKEGFEIGPTEPPAPSQSPAAVAAAPIILTEANVFPPPSRFSSRAAAEQLHTELQSLGSSLLNLLARSLGQSPDRYSRLLHSSISTLRLLHYPPSFSASTTTAAAQPHLCCTPHTDSGLLTLLHQDPTGGLEVLNAAGAWIAAPYMRDTLVVNIGDLLAHMSQGRFVATRHRVRASGAHRYSVPFFCEPGADALVHVNGANTRYADFVLAKMSLWVEFQHPGLVLLQQQQHLDSDMRAEIVV